MSSKNLSATDRLRAGVAAVFFCFALAAAMAIFGQYWGSETQKPAKHSGPREPNILQPEAASGSQPSEQSAPQTGHASWYEFSSRTASGEQMDASAMTAAHPSLPFGTKVLVENLSNGRSVVVRINDRGPFTGDRIIDLSKTAAASLGMIGAGIATVRIRRLLDAQVATE